MRGRHVSSYRAETVKVLQYVIGLIVLAWLLRQVRVERLRTLLDGLTHRAVAILIVVTLLGLLSRFYTWHVLVTHFERSTIWTAGRIDLVVNFVNQLLPSRLSGRGIAPLVIRYHTGVRWTGAVAIAGVHTGVYAILYGSVAVAGISMGFDRFPIEILALILLSTGLYIGAGSVVLLAGTYMDSTNRVVDQLDSMVGYVPLVGDRLSQGLEKWPEFTTASQRSFRSMVGTPGTLWRYAFGWLGALVVVPGIRVGVLLSAFGTTFEPIVLLPVYLVAAYSVTLLPLTPGGIGISEASAALVFTSLGVPYEVIVPVILTDRFLGTYLPALSGWVPAVKIDFQNLTPE